MACGKKDDKKKRADNLAVCKTGQCGKFYYDGEDRIPSCHLGQDLSGAGPAECPLSKFAAITPSGCCKARKGADVEAEASEEHPVDIPQTWKITIEGSGDIPSIIPARKRDA